MGFYAEISKYYDDIFPLSESKMEFFQHILKTDKQKQLSILDVGTATGSYAINLVKKGYEVTAVDSSETMVQQARKKAKEAGVNLNIFQLNMKRLVNQLNQKFDGVICIGNTLVHLTSLEEIYKMFNDMYKILNPQGKLIIQIVNYDRILKKRIKELPKIEKKEIDLEFTRQYEFVNENEIEFKTRLQVGDKEFQNSIPLYPLTSDELSKLLQKTGFSDYKFYGGFNFESYIKESSSPLVAVIEK